MPQNHDIFIFIEVRSSTFEVRVRLVFFEISSRCSKFGHAKVRVFKVRIFWVRSNTNVHRGFFCKIPLPDPNNSIFFSCGGLSYSIIEVQKINFLSPLSFSAHSWLFLLPKRLLLLQFTRRVKEREVNITAS